MCALLTPLSRSIVGAGRRGLAAQSFLSVPGSGRSASEPRHTIRTWATPLSVRPGSVRDNATGNRSRLSQPNLDGHLQQLYPCGRFPFARTFHVSAAFPAKSTLSKKASKSKSKKPEDLYPDSFPKQGELVNPSGRIYSVLRDPNEELLQRYARSGGTPVIQEPSILRAIIVGGALSLLCYEYLFVSSASETEDLAEKIDTHREAFADLFSSLPHRDNNQAIENVPGHDGISQDQLRAVKAVATATFWGVRLAMILDICTRLGVDSDTRKRISEEYTRVAQSYLALPEWKKAAVPIVAINTGVFLLWNIRHLPLSHVHSSKWASTMSRHFVHRPNSLRHYTLLTSTFSHKSLGHFVFNNFALWSCGAVAFCTPAFYAASFGDGSAKPKIVAEASIMQHFWAFFVVAGTFASLVSHLGTAIRWRVVAKWFKRTKVGTAVPGSLGASGAVYATFALTAMALPENRIGIIFLPSDYSVPIQRGMLAIVCIDIVGLVLRWRYLDHVAHLAGAAFGYLYFHYGAAYWKTSVEQSCVRLVKAKAKEKEKEKKKQGEAIESKS